MQLKTLIASNDQIDDNSCKSVTVCDILIVDELVTLGESPKCDPTTKYVKLYLFIHLFFYIQKIKDYY